MPCPVSTQRGARLGVTRPWDETEIGQKKGRTRTRNVQNRCKVRVDAKISRDHSDLGLFCLEFVYLLLVVCLCACPSIAAPELILLFSFVAPVLLPQLACTKNIGGVCLRLIGLEWRPRCGRSVLRLWCLRVNVSRRRRSSTRRAPDGRSRARRGR